MIRTFVIALLLTGCASTFDAPKLERNYSRVTLETNAKLPEGICGQATWDKNGNCLIQLKEYPKCLGHEMRHCFEGNWHPRGNSSQDY